MYPQKYCVYSAHIKLLKYQDIYVCFTEKKLKILWGYTATHQKDHWVVDRCIKKKKKKKKTQN